MGIVEVTTVIPWFASDNKRREMFSGIRFTNWIVFLYLASTFNVFYIFLSGIPLLLHPINRSKGYYSWIAADNSNSYFNGITFYTIGVWYKRIIFSSTSICRVLYSLSPLHKIVTANILNDYLECGVTYEFWIWDIIVFILLQLIAYFTRPGQSEWIKLNCFPLGILAAIYAYASCVRILGLVISFRLLWAFIDFL